MDILKAFMKLYYEATLNELKLMNTNTLIPAISYNSLLYLDLIAYNENCTVSYLADAIHISKPAVTLKINELIAQGLVEKKQSTKDRRIYYISLTNNMQKEYRKFDKPLINAAQLIEKKYSKEDIDLFTSMLEDIRKEYTKEYE